MRKTVQDLILTLQDLIEKGFLHVDAAVALEGCNCAAIWSGEVVIESPNCWNLPQVVVLERDYDTEKA